MTYLGNSKNSNKAKYFLVFHISLTGALASDSDAKTELIVDVVK